MDQQQVTASGGTFKPQDFSRFLIREFLKKNGFDQTYDQFMLEDTRPKVTMTKNELMRLLGIEALMKRNTKSKQYETMLDILCDFLIIQKEVTGGVELAQGGDIASTSASSMSSSQQSKVVKAAPVKKAPVKQGAQQWFSNDAEEVIAEDNSPSGDNEEAAAELMERHLPSKLG